MNEPHVEFLYYRLKTGNGLKFENPPPLPHDGGRFTCCLESDRLTVEMREHHDSEDSARAIVNPFCEAWEAAETLNRGRREIWFEYEDAKIIDLNPPPRSPSQGLGAVATDTGTLGLQGELARVVRGERTYPPPPSAFIASPDVKMLLARYQEYAEGREPLASMAFACYKYIVEVLAPDQGAAAKKFNLSVGRDGVLSTVRRLAGGKGQRKRLAQEPYTPQEETWLATTIRLLIRRVGEHAAGVPLKQITMADLPKLS